MELVTLSATINAPVEIVWPLFADFGGVDRIFPTEGVPPLGFITKVEMEGDGVGSIRTMHFSSVDPVQERLTYLDSDSLVMEYEAFALPIGVEDYHARIEVQRTPGGEARVSYTAHGVPTFMTQPELRDALSPLFLALVARARQIAEQQQAGAV